MSYLRQITNDKSLWLMSEDDDPKSPMRFAVVDGEPITKSLTQTEVEILVAKLQHHYFALTGRAMMFRAASTLRVRQLEFIDGDGESLTRAAREVVEAHDLGWGVEDAVKKLRELVR